MMAIVTMEIVKRRKDIDRNEADKIPAKLKFLAFNLIMKLLT